MKNSKSLTIKDIREQTPFSLPEFARWLDIPLRTMESWEAGTRQPPKYVLDLIQHKVLTSKIPEKVNIKYMIKTNKEKVSKQPPNIPNKNKSLEI